MIVYRVTFPNGKCYVGMTTLSLHKRKIKHYWNAFHGDRQGFFYNALRKYGKQEVWEVIDSAETVEALRELEKKHIAEISDGYNLTIGGDGVCGYRHSWGTRQKMSETRKGVKKSAEFIEGARARRLGKTWSQETKNKISASLKNRTGV